MTPRLLLTRYSFQSLFRSDALSESGLDAYRAWLVSIVIGVVVFHLYLLRLLARKYGAIAVARNHPLFLSAVAADELFYLAAAFVFVTIVAALQWQSLFPGERDHQVLSPLPLPRSDIFLSRLAALAMFLGFLLAAVSIPPALTFPALATGPFPLEPFYRRLAAHLAAGIGAGLHAFLLVLALQGICLTLFSARLRGAVSFLTQGAILTAAIASIPLVTHIPGLFRLLDTRAPWLAWLPPVWWLGVCETLRGSPDPWYHELAFRAFLAATLSLLIGAFAYFRLYRGFSSFANPPQPLAPRPSPLLGLARRDDNGQLAFIALTLARSPHHRLILCGIAAVGAAIALDGFLAPILRQWTRARTPGPLPLENSLALPLLMTFSLAAALRMTFRIPQQWPANWIFRFTEFGPARPGQLEAAVAANYYFAVLPSMLIALPFQWVAIGPWGTVAALPLLGLINAALIEFTFQDWQRLPFTATYAPAHRPAAISFVFFMVAFSLYGYGSAGLVGALIRNPLHWLVAIAALGALCVHLRRKRRSHWGHEPFSFADDGGAAFQVTGFAPE